MSTKDEKSPTAAEMAEAVFAFIRRSLAFWKRSMLVFFVIAGVAVPMVFLKPRAYRSETIVLYQENIKSQDITGSEGSGENARRTGARLREMLFSRASLEPIVKSLPRYTALAERRGMVDAVEELRQHITFQAREGDTFEIGYEGLSPQEAQDVTRRLGDRIVDEAARQRAEQSKATKDYLEAQSEQNKTKLKKAEQDLWSFLTIHPEFIPLTLPGGGQKTVVVMPGSPTGAPGAAAAVPRGDPVLANMEAEARAIDHRLKAARGEAPPPPPPQPVAESPEVQAARKDLAEKRALYTEQHPDVVAAKRRLQAAIEADKKNQKPEPPPAMPAGKMSDAEKEALENRLAALRRSIAARRAGGSGAVDTPATAASGASSSSAAVALEVEFRRLQRDVDYLKEAQKQLDDKLFKAGLTEGASMNERNIQVKILDPAYLPAHPSSKPRSTALATYLAIAIVLALVVALVSARLDDRIYQRKDLEVLDILPVIGVIPRE
jgi:hypothetical protein